MHKVVILPHARERMEERGAEESEVVAAVTMGESTPGNMGRMRFIKNFSFDGTWKDRHYTTKQVHALTARHGDEWRVVTVIVKYFGKD